MTQVTDKLDAPPGDQQQSRQVPLPSPDEQGRQWVNKVLGRTPVDLPGPSTDDAPEGSENQQQSSADAAPAEPQPQADTGTDRGAPASDDVLTLTPAQLQQTIRQAVENYAQTELPRQTQAEVDRREARRKSIEEKERLKRLADEDPFQFTEEQKKRMQLEEDISQSHMTNMQIYSTAVSEFDGAVMDQLTSAVPQDVAKQLLGDGLSTIQDRGKYAANIVKTVRAQGYQEGMAAAREKLKKDPAFKKEYLAELRASGGVAEPETVMGQPANRDIRDPGTMMNTLIRKGFGQRA